MHRRILYTQIMERTDCEFLITMEEKSSKNITNRQRTQRAKRIPKSLKLEVPKILNYQDYWQRELCSHYSDQLGWLLAAHEHKPAHTGELRVLLIINILLHHIGLCLACALGLVKTCPALIH